MTKARENSDYTGLQAEIVAGDTAARAGRKNLILNGSMQISQRGDYTSASTISNGNYYLDRIMSYAGNVTGTIQDMGGSIKHVSTLSATGYLGAEQRIEDYARLSGKTITISADVRSNSTDTRIQIYDSAYRYGDNAHSGGGGWEKLTQTFTVSTSLTRLWIQLWISGSSTLNTAIASGDYVEFKNLQVEEGSVATDFEHRSYGEELALCQRYGFRVTGGRHVGGWGSGTSAYVLINAPVTLRRHPTSIINNKGSLVREAIGWYTVTGLSGTTDSGLNNLLFHATCSNSGAAQGDHTYLGLGVDIFLDSEL